MAQTRLCNLHSLIRAPAAHTHHVWILKIPLAQNVGPWDSRQVHGPVHAFAVCKYINVQLITTMIQIILACEDTYLAPLQTDHNKIRLIALVTTLTESDTSNLQNKTSNLMESCTRNNKNTRRNYDYWDRLLVYSFHKGRHTGKGRNPALIASSFQNVYLHKSFRLRGGNTFSFSLVQQILGKSENGWETIIISWSTPTVQLVNPFK